ncbi:MAG: hypothetical protein KatS3mg124_0904 [Porticoccaceae bacterium]|nr:MAG: hypothetical protein KatS3mg124_0904 [Porticoccaceae bacterium]
MSLPVPDPLRLVEAALDRLLALDPGTRHRLGALAGRRIAVRCTQPQWRFLCAFTPDGRIRLERGEAGRADLELRGSAVALAALPARLAAGGALAGSGVRVAGNAELLGSLARILADLDLDWEMPLAAAVGDVGAHLLGEAVRTAGLGVAGALARALAGSAEYLREESGLAVARAEAETWQTEVRRLAADVERLAARVALLERARREARAVPGRP